ncbi:MAG TPA: cell division protein FtsQ/DivIB, partial [Rhodothermales bacterium]|nr:cell division protein FtsQ/DivIB [Rhodothermales bacterium]
AVLAAAAATLWIARVRLVRVEVRGVPVAWASEVARLARVAHGDRLYSLRPALLEDRIRRHPYVAQVEATRLPWGVLRVSIRPRRPVALALGADGTPAALLDAEGYAMPLPAVLPDDLPLVHGATLPVNRSIPVASASLRRLLADLPMLGPAQDALVSDFQVAPSGEIVLVSAPTPSGQALRVRLGREDFGGRIERFRRFWHQAVLTRPARRFKTLDLRFHGLVVTREADAGQAFPDSVGAPPDSILVARPDTLRA